MKTSDIVQICPLGPVVKLVKVQQNKQQLKHMRKHIYYRILSELLLVFVGIVVTISIETKYIHLIHYYPHPWT